jgi:hypothetical protein
MAQNTLDGFDFDAATRSMKYFMTGDPNSPSHWLTRVSIGLNAESFVAERVASELVDIQLTIYQTCDRRSCMGCATPRLTAMCYALQQCSIVRCIGTVVNQVRPLCNIGLLAQSLADQVISLGLATWLAFSESYANLLRISLTKDRTATLLFVDDAFFGSVCAAKNVCGQMSALLTSAIGSAMITGNSRMDPHNEQAGLVDTKASARNTLVLNSVNAFLYQMSLYPLYILLAYKKIAMCALQDVSALITVVGFNITIGSAGFTSADALMTGECMTSYQEEEVAIGIFKPYFTNLLLRP